MEYLVLERCRRILCSQKKERIARRAKKKTRMAKTMEKMNPKMEQPILQHSFNSVLLLQRLSTPTFGLQRLFMAMHSRAVSWPDAMAETSKPFCLFFPEPFGDLFSSITKKPNLPLRRISSWVKLTMPPISYRLRPLPVGSIETLNTFQDSRTRRTIAYYISKGIWRSSFLHGSVYVLCKSMVFAPCSPLTAKSC